MGKKYRNLIGKITSLDNLWEAYRKASKGKRSSLGYLRFREYEGSNIAKMQSLLITGEYTPGKHRDFFVYEPKKRKISALPFADRIVQHALIEIIGPIFTKGMLKQSWACIKGRGMHGGACNTQAMIRRKSKDIRPVQVLKTDYSKYFASIRRPILWDLIEAKISCRATLALIEKFLPKEGVGLPIGNLDSQLWANVYGTIVDRYLVHGLKISSFSRYMDDIVIIHNSRAVLNGVRDFLKLFSAHNLGLKFSCDSIRPASQGVNFLGFRIFKHYKLLRKDSVVRAKRKIRRYTKNNQPDKLQLFLASWLGHAQWADSFNLINNIASYYKQEQEKYVCTHA